MNDRSARPQGDVTPRRHGRRHGRRLAVLGVATAGVLALAACGGGGGSSTGGGGGSGGGQKVLTLATVTAPVSLDPVKNTIYPPLAWYDQLAYEPLIRIDSNGEFVPALAASWRYTNDDNTEFEVTLRDGVTFSDGAQLTAKNVVDSVEYAIKTGVNGPAWLSGVSDVSAPTATTVLFKLNAPSDQMPFLLSQRVMLATIISSTGLSDTETLKNTTHGAGPYQLDDKATVANNSYVYVPNPNYYDKATVKWDKVVIKVVSNYAAALQATQSGQVDAFFGDASTAKAAGSSANLEVTTKLTGATGINYADTKGEVSSAIGQPKVRQALSHAINRDAIAGAVYGGLAKANATMTADGLAGYSADNAGAYAYDPARAKQLLQEAGYGDGFSFDMATSNDGNDALVAQAIVQDWAKIGVTAKLTTYKDSGQMVTDLLAHKYPVSLYDYGTLPMYIQSKSFFTGGATQYNAFDAKDDEITKGLRTAATGKTFDEQSAAYAAVLKRAEQDLAWSTNVISAPSILIYNKTRVTGMERSVISPTPNIAWTVAPAS